MGKQLDHLTPELTDWIEKQRLFFVATAPLAAEARLNCSPKGLDTFRILGPKCVAYLDLMGSGIETVAHLKENGRIVIMFCAMDGPPQILRLHGQGEVILPGESGFAELMERFPQQRGVRSIIRANLTHVSTSCGFGVPHYQFVSDRTQMTRWIASKDDTALAAYREKHNSTSVDGLKGL